MFNMDIKACEVKTMGIKLCSLLHGLKHRNEKAVFVLKTHAVENSIYSQRGRHFQETHNTSKKTYESSSP